MLADSYLATSGHASTLMDASLLAPVALGDKVKVEVG